MVSLANNIPTFLLSWSESYQTEDNRRLSAVLFSYQMCSFNCSRARRFHILSGLQLSLQIVRHEEVRRPGWSGDATKTWNDASGTHGSKLIYVLCTRWDRLDWNHSSPSASSASTSVSSIARYHTQIRVTVQLPCFARHGDHSPDVMHQQLPPFSTGNLPGSGLGGRPKIHSPGPPTRKLRDSAQYCLVQTFVIKAMNVRVIQEQKDFSTSLESFNATCCTEIVKW